MTSSTSSSEHGRQRLRPLLWIATGIASFAASLYAGDVATRSWDALAYTHPFPTEEQLPSGGWYVDDGFGVASFAHEVLYHGFGKSIANAREADVLFLGNSGTLAALPHDVLDSFFGEHGLTYFNLGFGHGEGLPFARALLERHELEPRLFVVNAEHFFVDVPSRRAARVMGKNAFQDLRGCIETGGAWTFRQVLRPLLPHYVPMIPVPTNLLGVPVHLRSERHGSWLVWRMWDRGLPIDLDGGRRDLWDFEVSLGRAFLERARAHGGEVVLIKVPTHSAHVHADVVRELGERLELPVLTPELPRLTTYDRFHLSPSSAERWSRALLAELEEEPAFRALTAP